MEEYGPIIARYLEINRFLDGVLPLDGSASEDRSSDPEVLAALEEKEQLEERFRQAPELMEALKNEIRYQYIIQESGLKEQKTQMDARFKDLYQKENIRLLQRRRYLMAAAAVVLLLVIAIPFLLNRNPQVPLPDLYAQHFERPRDPAPLPRAEDPPASYQDSLWQAAAKEFSQANHQATIDILNLIKQDPEETSSGKASFYLGVVYLQMNQTDQAIALFNQVSSTSNYLDQTRWYRALTYMVMNDREKSRSAIQELIDSGQSFKHEQAKEILELL
ncbi:MAG: tetratricopeptide repeat protein [Bacteroidota bacterium]